MSLDYDPVPCTHPPGCTRCNWCGFGAETGPDWFECLTDEPDFAAMTGLARGIRWSDVLGEIEAEEERLAARRAWLSGEPLRCEADHAGGVCLAAVGQNGRCTRRGGHDA